MRKNKKLINFLASATFVWLVKFTITFDPPDRFGVEVMWFPQICKYFCDPIEREYRWNAV